MAEVEGAGSEPEHSSGDAQAGGTDFSSIPLPCATPASPWHLGEAQPLPGTAWLLSTSNAKQSRH